jgi:hypothetical protein
VDTVFTGNPSSTWTTISHGLGLLKKGLVWRVGNGESIRVWRDSWLPRTTNGKVLTPKGNNRIRVSELIDAHGKWNIEKIYDTFYPIDVDAILRIKPSLRGFDDILAWQPERSGIFTVKSAYNLAFSELPIQCNFGSSSTRQGGRDSCWKKIWSSSVPPKVKTFAWKAASNALATEQNKLNINMKVTGHCHICYLEKEDVAHALYYCPHAHHLWNACNERLLVSAQGRGSSYPSPFMVSFGSDEFTCTGV